MRLQFNANLFEVGVQEYTSSSWWNIGNIGVRLDQEEMYSKRWLPSPRARACSRILDQLKPSITSLIFVRGYVTQAIL